MLWRGTSGNDRTISLVMLNGGSPANIGGGMVRRCSGEWVQFFVGEWEGGNSNTPSVFEENTAARTSVSGFSNIYFTPDFEQNSVTCSFNQSLLTNNAGFRNRAANAPQRYNLCMGGLGGFDIHHATEFVGNVSVHSSVAEAMYRFRAALISDNIFQRYNSPGTGSILVTSGEFLTYPGASGSTVFERNIFRSDYSDGAIGSWGNLISTLQAGATITFRDNDFLKPSGGTVTSVIDDARLIFENNRYYSTAATGDWFSGQTYAEMIPSTGAAVTMANYPDPGRDMVSYMASIGPNPASVAQALDWYCDGVPDTDLAGALANRRGAWDERFTAKAVINYIRAGYGMGAI